MCFIVPSRAPHAIAGHGRSVNSVEMVFVLAFNMVIKWVVTELRSFMPIKANSPGKRSGEKRLFERSALVVTMAATLWLPSKSHYIAGLAIQNGVMNTYLLVTTN